MLKLMLGRASVGSIAILALCAASSLFAQDAKPALSVGSIRPFERSEVPANQAPNLERNSSEFQYFRNELGRKGMSTREKARLAALAARVVYDDPMDKPTVYGEKFINIFDPDEVFEDGKAFVGEDDPDVQYSAAENNVLAKFAEVCQKGSAAVSLLGAASDANKQGMGPNDPSMMAPSAPMLMGPSAMMRPGDPTSMQKAEAPKVEPSEKDDSALIFPVAEGEKAAENPFSGSVTLDPAVDFDLFKADREFKVKAPAKLDQKAMMMMGPGAMMGPSSMVGPPSAPMGPSGSTPTAPTAPSGN